jgi:acyl-CoA thioesterase
MSKSNKIGVYHIEVRNQENTLVALFKGMVYRTGKEWDF